MNQNPSIGRIVHHQAYGAPGGEYLPEPRSAIVTVINADDSIGAFVITPTGSFHHQSLGDMPTPGCWNWPPRV